jgi:hypothetical protein
MPDSMEAPNIAAARDVVARAQRDALGVANNSEQLVNDMLAGGMGNDADTMAKVQAAQELSAQAAAAWDAAHTGLQGHAQGEEYANTGKAAKTEYLQS